MSVKIFRRGSARCIGLFAAFFTVLLFLYYISMGQTNNDKTNQHALHDYPINIIRRDNIEHNIDNGPLPQQRVADNAAAAAAAIASIDFESDNNGGGGILSETSKKIEWNKCSALTESKTDITTLDEFTKFDFQPEWMKTKEYWDKTFETRYEKMKKGTHRWPLKVIIVPHSHNDPGWLKTFVNYFQSDTRQILNYVITKMHEFEDMTFIWSEISFLQMWWDQAHPTKQRALKQLVDQGRFEITTGGWVMTDEANVHVYAMVDQLIEGHQWVQTHLNYTPVTGWSIDPFGHGSTVPYLLAASGFTGTIIQRIHYAWKQWLAQHQQGDFQWTPYWADSPRPAHPSSTYPGKNTMLTHNMPYDIYSIKHSCGPHPFICLNFDFRKVPGEYTEYSIKAQFITNDNIEAKADLLMEQYTRTASLYPHNVVLVPIGDDFRYNKEHEVEQQYTNYKKLIDYINSRSDRYHAQIGFGLPRDYFAAISERTEQFPTLKGDFFVYSDIFTEAKPAYWSGYFTTRPAYKILSRELEHNLRSLEILFTIAFNRAHQSDDGNHNALRIFEKNYEKLVLARRNLGLFQHHDAITGTSKANVMRDYGMRLFESIQDTVKLQGSTIEMLIQYKPRDSAVATEHDFILSELERESFNKLPRKSPIYFGANLTREFVVFNSLAQERVELVVIRSQIANVEVLDADGQSIAIQVNPLWNITEPLDSFNIPIQNSGGGSSGRRIRVSDKQFEILFVARLPPLSLVTFTMRKIEMAAAKSRMATLYCDDCKDEESHQTVFEVRNKQPGDIQLDNFQMRLLFDGQSGFLKTVTKKNVGKAIQCAVKFAAYRSAQFHSGAYLFKTDPEHRDAEKDVLEQYNSDIRILITSGPIASDVSVLYGPFLAHTVRVFNTKTELDQAIYIENDIDFEPAPKNRETELFMRIVTDIENGDVPELYSDLNGFQFQRRLKVPSIGVEGNYFPITSAAFIQDRHQRMTLLTTHAQGAASLEPGHLEVMIDRRTLYDDYRGMGEGVVDSRLTQHKYWLMLEDIHDGGGASDPAEYQVASRFVNHMSNALNYPANLYTIERSDDSKKMELNRNVLLLAKRFPCDLHLMTLRSQTDPELPLFPVRSALMVLHRQGYSCRVGDAAAAQAECTASSKRLTGVNLFSHLKVASIRSTLLTGMKAFETITDFENIYVKPMEIRTFNVSFSGT